MSEEPKSTSQKPTEVNHHQREFRTHIKEPRWEQVVSVLIIIAIIVFWLIEQF